MITTNTVFEHELKKLVDEEIDRLKDILADGKLADIAAYKYYAGQIFAYRQLVDTYFSETNTKISKR